jgi:WD40 repeat protein
VTERDIFLAAIDRPDAAARAAYLAAACAGDPALRDRVEALLRSHEGAGSFLASQAAAPPDATAAPPPAGPETGTIAHADPDATGTTGSVGPVARVNPPLVGDGIGAVVAGRYTLVEVLGEGGMGTVYRAEQTEPVRRAVALKLIRAGMDSKAVLARFDAERQALALMDHPNIARIYDGGVTDNGRPFFVMELVEGVPVTDYCDRNRLPVRARLELFVAVCRAVQHAHQKGIIHRDLKPGNVLVAEADGRPTPKVIDFGVAKATGQRLTDLSVADTGMIVGTPAYMSPEQADPAAADVDTRTDVYALGVILYELLAGSPPIDPSRFKRGAVLEMLRMVREVDPPRPSTKVSSAAALPNIAATRGVEPEQLRRSLRGDLDWIVMKALEKDRARRYESANGFATDVLRHLAYEPVLAAPPSRVYRLRRFVRKHRAAVVTAVAFVLLLLLGAAVSAWQAVAATRAEKVASDERDAAKTAREAEAAAHTKTEEARAETAVALLESRRMTARMTYERAQALCEEGKADIGLLWMARSLGMTPAESPDLDRAIRLSINLWAAQVKTIRPATAKSEWRRMPPVRDTAISPDGLTYLTANDDGIARLWEVPAGNLRRALPLEPNAPKADADNSRVAYSLDGRFVAATRGDQNARVWDAATGRSVGPPLAHEKPVAGVGFHPAGMVLATTSGTQLRFWNVERGMPDGEPLTVAEDVKGPEFSADGRHLLVWGRTQLQIRDAATRTVRHAITGIDFEVLHAAFTPDGRHALVRGQQRTSAGERGLSAAQFWDVESGQPTGDRMLWELDFFGSYVKSAFRPDGRVAVTGGELRLWEVPTGKSLGARGPQGFFRHPVFTRDGRVLLGANPAPTDGLDGWQLLDVPPGLLPGQSVPVGTNVGAFAGFTVGPDGRTAVSSHVGGTTQTYCLYDLRTGSQVGNPVKTQLPQATSIFAPPAYSPDGRTLATAAGKNACQLRDAATGQQRGPRLGMDAPVRALAFSPDGQLLAGGDLEGGLRLWHAATGRPAGPPLKHTHAVTGLRFSPDGRRLLATGGVTNRVFGEARVWDVATGHPIGPALELSGAVHAAAFSPDGKTFATGTFQLALWETETGRKLWTAPVSEVTEQLAFSPDGRHLLARHLGQNSARLYDARTGDPSSPHLRHPKPLNQSVFSPDGRFILTCSYGGPSRLWDAATGLPLGPAWSQLSAVKGYAAGRFAPDGRGVFLPDGNAIVRWDIPDPIEGSVEQIRLGIEAATRQSLDPFGGEKVLYPALLPLDIIRKNKANNDPTVFGPDPWEPVRARLLELGGPPGYLRR